jgi:hypothetical protein
MDTNTTIKGKTDEIMKTSLKTNVNRKLIKGESNSMLRISNDTTDIVPSNCEAILNLQFVIVMPLSRKWRGV